MFMYESASISVTFFSNMAAYPGGFEDEDDEDSCISCLDTTKYRCLVKQMLASKRKRRNFRLESWKVCCVFRALLERSLRARHTYSTHAVGGENAVSGLKAPFSLFR